MPSEYHSMNCHCRECRCPAGQKATTPLILARAALLGLVAFSISVFAFVAYATGGGL